MGTKTGTGLLFIGKLRGLNLGMGRRLVDEGVDVIVEVDKIVLTAPGSSVCNTLKMFIKEKCGNFLK